MLYNGSDFHVNKSWFSTKRWEFTRQNLTNFLTIIINSVKDSKTKWNTLSIAWDIFHDKVKDFRKWELWFAETIISFSKEIQKIDPDFEIPSEQSVW